MLHDDETRSSAPQAEATDEAVLLADAGSPLQPLPASAETHAEAGDEIMLSEGAGLGPLAIAGGMLGVVAVASAGAGGSQGAGPAGAHHGPSPLAQKPPARSEPSAPAASSNDGPIESGETASHDTTRPSGPAIAQGEADAPHVAVEGHTRLSAASFRQAAVAGVELEYVRIDRILAADGTDPEARVIRYDTESSPGSSTGKVLRMLVKAGGEDGRTTASPPQLTAYEVIRIDGGISRADAIKRAATMGGKLLEINDADELRWLSQNLFGVLGPTDDDTSAAGEHLAAHGAWFGGNRMPGADPSHDAVKRAGGPQDGIHSHDATPETLSHFVIEYNNYQSPLGIQGADGKIMPILEGQTIRAADLDKLVWNGDQNRVGEIRLQAVLTDEGSTAEAVPGSTPVTLSITESAAVRPPVAPTTPMPPNEHNDAGVAGQPPAGGQPSSEHGESDADPATPPALKPPYDGPDYSNNVEKPEFSVPQDWIRQLPARLFQGVDLSRQPHFIKIVGVEENGAHDTGNAKSPLILHLGTSQERAVDEGAIIHRFDFDKLHWNSKQNSGGSLRFIALDARQQPIAGAPEQTITLYEQPKPPAYPNDGQQVYGIARDEALPLTAPVFKGDADEHAPDRIKIISVHEIDDTDPARSALVRLDADGTAEGLKARDVLQKEDLGKIQWHTADNRGGSFSFVALDQHGNHLGKVQTVTVYELPEAPDYSQQPARQTVAHDSTTAAIDRVFFDGADAARAPAWIRITDVTETADSDTGHSALTVARAGLSSAELKVGDIVAFDDFDHLYWDARTNTGGRFSFQALDQHKQPIAGSAVQTITIHEQQATPGYPGNGLASQSFPLGTTGFRVLDNGIFNGIPPVNKPAFIGITEVSAIGTNHQADDHPVLYRGNEAGDQKTPLSADDLLAVPSSDFDKLFWDSTHNIAGSFRFQPLDEYRNPIAGSPSIRVQISEQDDNALRDDAAQADGQLNTAQDGQTGQQPDSPGKGQPDSQPDTIRESQAGDSPNGPADASDTDTGNGNGNGNGNGKVDDAAQTDAPGDDPNRVTANTADSSQDQPGGHTSPPDGQADKQPATALPEQAAHSAGGAGENQAGSSPNAASGHQTGSEPDSTSQTGNQFDTTVTPAAGGEPATSPGTEQGFYSPTHAVNALLAGNQPYDSVSGGLI